VGDSFSVLTQPLRAPSSVIYFHALPFYRFGWALQNVPQLCQFSKDEPPPSYPGFLRVVFPRRRFSSVVRTTLTLFCRKGLLVFLLPIAFIDQCLFFPQKIVFASYRPSLLYPAPWGFFAALLLTLRRYDIGFFGSHLDEAFPFPPFLFRSCAFSCPEHSPNQKPSVHSCEFSDLG